MDLITQVIKLTTALVSLVAAATRALSVAQGKRSETKADRKQ